MTRASGYAWVLNLDAELELANPHYQPSAKVALQLAEYAERARALLGPDDVLIEPGQRLEEPRVGRAWCPTRNAVRRLMAAGAVPEPFPESSVVLRANHRRFAAELGAGPPGSRFVEELAELEGVIRRAPGRWLLKRPLGFAGRGQLRVGSRLDAAARRWVESSWALGGLAVEPLVTPTLELAQHGFLSRAGRCRFGRPCVQRVGPHGVWQASEPLAPGTVTAEQERALFEAAERAAEALVRLGYFGPFGIDAYTYELDGVAGFCALSEVNARYSMGFAAGFGVELRDLHLE